MPFLLALVACLRDAPLPDVGDCAVYPDGTYDYGEIGIGTCLAGPTDMALIEDADGRRVLLVVNADPYRVFSGGSLLALDWDAIEEARGELLVSEVALGALDLPDFSGALAVWGDLGLVTARLSEDARTRVHDDRVYLVDLSDPADPREAFRGPDGDWTVEVGSDPNDVVVDPDAGRAYVANRTSHSVSVLDLTGETVEVVAPWPEQVVTEARLHDLDLSGSRASMASFEVTDSEALTDDDWTLTWVDGTWRLWVPGITGLWRTETTGTGEWHDSGLGVELEPSDAGADFLWDPAWHASTARMFFVADGVVRVAESSTGAAGDWSVLDDAVLEPREGEWDAEIGGPDVVDGPDAGWLFYDGFDGETGAIGAATTLDGLTFERLDQPVLEPAWDHEAIRVADPFVLYDPEAARWVMYYGAFDGERWTIGRAVSDDLEAWESDPEPVFELADGDAAAPVVSRTTGDWRMWYARRTDAGWSVGEARSADGLEWEDRGTVVGIDAYVAFADEPPGVALQAARTDAFRVEGAATGSLLDPAWPGVGYDASAVGWSALVVAGFEADAGDAGAASEGGISVGSADPDAGRAWLTLVSTGGTPRIGVARIDDAGDLEVEAGAVFSGGGDFDRDGAFSPVVVRDDDGTFRMYYAGLRGEEVAIGLATSEDGRTWTRVGEVLAGEDDWDAVAVVPGSVEELPDGRERLWFAGSDGEVWRIGAAVTEDGEHFELEGGERAWLLGPGAPGAPDDSGVRDPWAVRGTDAEGNPGTHLWYAGTDGDTWRVFYAWLPDGSTSPERATDPATGDARPVIDTAEGLFHPDGVRRPVLVEDGAGGWRGWYAGLLGQVARVGAVRGREPDRLHRTPRRPTAGDELRFSTRKGDSELLAIPLDQAVEDGDINGIGLSSLALDAERGMLHASSKLHNYIVTIDIRDDSDAAAGTTDTNYLDVEAVLPVTTSSGALGFRQVLPIPGEDLAWALNDAPEGVWVLDLSELEDDGVADVIHDSAVGWLPAARGAERDAGADTQSSVGPAAMALLPDGRHLLVTNFNANSATLYDLTIGPWGEPVADIPLRGDNPYAVLVSPDGRRAVVALYTGQVSADDLASSELAVVDLDEDSPTWLEVLAWISNR